MIVSDDLELAFVHVPHAAGTSISSYIKSRAPDAEKRGHKHCPASEAPDGHFTFCVVRNHWDWILSAYKHTVRWEGGPAPERYQYIQENDADVSQFAKWYTQTDERSEEDVWSGQFHWTGEGAEDVDFYMRMDGGSIEGVGRVKREFGFEGSLPHANKNTDERRRGVFTDEAAEAVRDHYRDEIDFFDFSF